MDAKDEVAEPHIVRVVRLTCPQRYYCWYTWKNATRMPAISWRLTEPGGREVGGAGDGQRRDSVLPNHP